MPVNFAKRRLPVGDILRVDRMNPSKNISDCSALVIRNMVPVSDAPFLPVKNVKIVSFYILHLMAVDHQGRHYGKSLFFQQRFDFFRPIIIIVYIWSAHDFRI